MKNGRSWWALDVTGVFVLVMFVGYAVLDLADLDWARGYLCCAGLGFLLGRGVEHERARRTKAKEPTLERSLRG